MSSCPNITSPEWKALVNKIGENNAWREFLANGYIPSVDNYDVIENVSTLKEQKTKPGVEELFDSNPELANAVYEEIGFIPSMAVYEANYENVKDQMSDMNNNFVDNLIVAGVGYKYFKEVVLNIDDLDLSKKTKGWSTNESDYLKEELTSINSQKNPILINDKGQVVEGWHRIHSLKANGVKTIKAYIPITPQQKQQALQLYSQYLDTVFPDSKVKDIVYHGTKSNEVRTVFDKETIQKTGVSLGKGFFFSKRKDYVERDVYGFKKIGSYLLNTTNPINGNPDKFLRETDFDRVPNKNKSEIKDDYLDDNGERIYTTDRNINFESDEERTKVLQQLGYDAVDFNKGEYSNEIVVFEPEQIHILGGKQDIEGFKEFVSDETNVTEKKDVLYSIRTKSLEQIAKGLNTDLIRSEQQIKYSGYVKSMVLNLLGDIGPGKKMKMSPTQAFQEAKQKFIEINNNIALTLNSYIKSEENLQTIKNSESYSEMLEFLPTLEYINTYEDLVKAASVYKNVVDDFNSYVDFVKIDLAHNGVRITKGKIENIDIKEKTINEEDETSDDGGGISQNEIGQKYGQDSFEVNPRDTASIRVKALIQTIAIPGEFEFGVPIYASPNDVFADMLEIGSDINLSGYKSKKTKLQKFKEQLSQRGESRPYLKNLLEKIINYENNNQWDNINDILTVSSKSYAIETLLLYKLKRVGSDVFGISDVKIISTNRDTVDKQISKEWLFQNVQSDFYKKDSFGDIFPKQEKINQLTKIIEEGLNKDRTVQIQKFQEFFDILGIKFSDTEAKSIAEKLPKLLKKSDFNQFFVKKNLLNNIVDSFQTHIKEPFTGQYGFENENTSMKKIAQIYYLENPGKYKITSTKTADGKSKYSYIFPTYLEQIKREWSNGKTSSITNGVLSKPNSQKQTSFWQKVISGNAKFDLQYFNGVREQKAGQKGDVRKTLTPKEQIVSMFLKHQQNLNVGSYIAFTLSDKTTTMETSMTKEFFVDKDVNPVGFNSDYTIDNGGIVYTTALKKKIYNSFVEPEISRILASIKNKKSTNIENHEIASKLFYFFPNLNRNTNLIDFRNDLYSGEFTIEEIAAKYGDVVSQAVLNEMIMASEKQVDDLISMNVIAVDDSNNYTFPTFINGYKENDYVNRFRKVSTTGKNMARLMVMDMKLNYLNSQIKTIQFLKFDPALAFKTSIDVKDKSISDIDVNDRVEIANSTWDEFSKRAASLIAPGSQGSWFWNLPNGEEYNEAGKDYLTVTGKDIKKEIKNTDGSKLNKSETTDAQEYVTMQEHIDYLMSEGKMDIDTWYSIYKKIKDAGPGGYYTLTSEELGIAFSPIKPVHVNSVAVGDPESGLNRIDYIKSSRYPLIPQHEAGSERDKLRIWMEKNNVRSVNFGSGKKIGRPTKSLTLFDENNDFIEPSSEDFELSKQFLSRDGLRNQQEIPDQKDKIRTVSQMNRTLFDGLLEVDDFQFGNMKDVSGATGKTLKEAVRSKLFDIETAKLTEKLGNNLNRDHRKLYELIKDVIVNDTTGSYTENDLNSLKINPETNQFEIPLEGLWKLTKLQSLINSLINKNVMLKVDGSSFIQVSGAGAKFSFSKISKGVKSDIIWLDKHAKQFAEDGATLKYMRQVDGKTKAAQVIVSQYLRDEEGNLINLANYIKEDAYGRKILDTSTFDEKMFQLIGTRIPNQSHPSTLPIEVVGFLPSYMENAMVVPDGITGQMGSDFDVDKLYTYFSKFKYKEKSTTEKLGANQEEYDELIESAKKIAKAAGEKADKKGIFKNFNTYLSQAVKEKYGDAEVPKFKIEKPASIEQVTYDLNSIEDVSNFSEDQLKQLYRDIHWEVLMNPATFSKITSSVDLPEVKSKVDIRNEQLKKYKLDEDVKVNLPLDFTTSINRYIDNRSGKTGVSIFATLISAQADFQDKIINLSFDGTPNPLQIKLSKNSKVINLEFIGKLGKSKSFLYEPGKIEERSISDNLNIMFTESVDNAKNQFLREFNWSDKAMSSVGVLAMLSDSNGDSAPIEIMMDLTSQPAISELFKLIEQKQDSFGQYEADAILTSAKELQNGIIKKIDNEGYLPTGSTAQSYFEDKTRNDVIDAESLSESWIIGKAVMQKASKETLEQIAKDFKYDSLNDMMLNYYNTQYNSIDTYIRLEDLGRELMTILGAIYPYTKGIGANVFSTKQRTNQLNKLQYSSNFSGLENIAGEITKLDNGDIQLAEPVGEIGSNIKNSLLFAQDLYKSLFPISSGEELESIVDNIVTFMGLDKLNLSKDKYETYYSTVFDSIVSYMKTNPSFELFKNVIEERNRLINGESSIGYRVLELKKDSKYSKNGFLKNIEVEKDYNSDTYVISVKSPFGSEIDEKEISLGFYNLALDENNDIKQLAKDFAIYPHATSDAGYLGRYIPVGYYMSDVDYKKAIADFQNMFNKHITTSGSKAILIDQIVQNNPEVFSKQFSFTTTKAVEGTYSNPFKKVFSKIVKSESLKDVNTFTFKIGDFPDTAKYKSTIKSLKIPLSENELKSIRESSLVNIPVGIDFKYPKYLLIKDQVLSDIPGIRNEDISYLYKRTSSIVTELGDATYERIEILGFKNISEFDFNNPNLVSSIKMNNVSRDENEQDAANDILNQPTTTTSEQKNGEPKGEKIKDGIYVNQEGLTKEEQLELFEYLKPILEKQAVRSNVGTNAPKMAGLELNWDYVRNRPTQTRVDVKGALRPNNTYGWFEKSANGLPLEKMSARFKELMSKAVGIDVSDYDGSIVNIYNDKSFISNHPDIDESKTAENYPVVVANIGGTGSIVVGTNTDNEKRSLKPGAGYLFGFQGKNRTIMHSTYPTATKGFLPAITTEIDGETYPAGSYRISITMRRVMPLEEGMPTEPAVITPIVNTTTANFNKKNLFTVTPQQGVSDNKAKVKASIATQYIGFGEGIVGKDGKRSSTQLYKEQIIMMQPFKGYQNMLWYYFVEKAKLLDPSKVDSIKNAKDYHSAWVIGKSINNTEQSETLLNDIYKEALNENKLANTGNYSADDVIFVSIPGARGDAAIAKREQDKTINEAIKAVEAGAIILTDNKAYTFDPKNTYNTGEKRLYKNMETKGYNYSEITVDGQVIGTWSKPTETAKVPLTAEEIYSDINKDNLTQSENVILPKDLEENTEYTGKNFWNDIVPEAKSMFDYKFPGEKPMLIAYRGNKKKTFLQNYKDGNTVGNPFDFADETGTRKEQGIKSTKKFIEWMITGNNFDNTNATKEYRQAIINDIKSGKIIKSPILYYEEKNYATHATALDYLINKYNWSKPTTPTVSEGIEINSKQTGLGNDLTNVHYATNGKSKFDIKPSDTSLSLTPEAKKTWGESVEAWYKSNNAKSKGIPEGIEGDAYDMKLMVGLITDKLKQYPNLVSEITNRGGMQFLDKSTHNMGTGRWSSKNPKNMFMNALKEAYQNTAESIIYKDGKNYLAVNGEIVGVQEIDEKGNTLISTNIEEQTEEPEVKTTTVEYGGKTFIIEGPVEDKYSVYFQTQGEKGKFVSDTNLPPKVILALKVNLHPDRVVTLTNIQNQPKYFVDLEGSIRSLQKTSFGDNIQSQDVIQRVMSLYYDKSQIETPEIKPQQVSETEDVFEEPFVETKPTKKEKRINVPEGSNPNNNVIMESEDTIFLMNDGQQEAFDFIKGKVENLLSNNKRITESDLEKKVAFIDPLTQKFNGLIPMDMWNNMIGLAGRGGVGKTTVIKAIIAAIEGKNKYSRASVMYLTPTHTAATVLQESLGLDSEIANDGVVNTIAAQTRRNKMIDGVLSLSTEKDYIKSTQFKPSMGQPDIIIVDESSMIGQKDFGDILLRIKQDLKNGLISRMPIFIFMGDYRQLGPIGEQQSKDVNKGLISSTLLLDKSKTKELTQVMRSDNKILHKIYDQVGNEIIENIENLKNNRPVKKLSFDKYDKLTKQSSENILVVKNEDGVIDDYTDYLIQNNNPYGMFWVHYNNVEHGNTKNLSKKIRNDYFKKLGLDFSSPSYRLYANKDYIIFDGKIEKGTSEYEYIPSDDKIKTLLDKQKYKVKNDTYTITRGSIKPGSRFKVLDIETKFENPSLYISNELVRYLPNNIKVEIEHTILYNRQDKIRHIHKILGFEVIDGKWNPVTKRMENIEIKNIKTGEKVSKFDLSYADYLKLKPELDEINQKFTPPFVPSYIGSSHTAQGNSIKNVIVGDYNIKKNAAANVNQDDIFSSMYVALTRTSGSLIIIKPAGTDIVNNQEVFQGVITDANQAQRMTSASEIKSDIEEAEYEEENEPIDFKGDLFAQIMQSDQNNLITDIFGKDKNSDTKTILNSLYKSNISPFYKQVLDLVSKTGGVGNLKIIVDETMTDPGSYNRYEQTIRINPKLAFESDPDNINALYDVIIHELFHHVTANIIEMDKSKLTPDQRKWVISLENLFKFAQEKILNDPAHADNLKNAIAQVNKEGGFLSAKDKSFYYGLTNIHDFVSMLMSDEKFRDFMNNTSYSGEKTLMERFIDIFVNILKALGISVKEDSVLKEGIKNVIGIVESRNQNDAQTDQTLKSIKTKSFLDGIIESEFDKIINYLDIKTKCK